MGAGSVRWNPRMTRVPGAARRGQGIGDGRGIGAAVRCRPGTFTVCGGPGSAAHHERSLNHISALSSVLALVLHRIRDTDLSLWGRATRAGVALIAALTCATLAQADPIEDFYRGKQIKMYIRAAPGGNYDVYSRVLGRH